MNRGPRLALLRIVALGLAASSLIACAEGTVSFETDDASGGAPPATTTAGGQGGGEGGQGGASVPLPCGIDCATIMTDACHAAICNEATKQCEVTNAADGAACDDGLFCTKSDSCQAGLCKGGPPNDCDMPPPACAQITCNEAAKSCGTTPSQEGTPCNDPNDLCVIGGKCQNGLCIGQQNDCFFAPLPSDCHVAVCNPQNGMCEPKPGNDGKACTDPKDLCTVGKTCGAGTCGSGTPKNCSAMTKGCTVGVCDVGTGMCVGKPGVDGDKCDDLNYCTTGELCTLGTCGGGTPVAQCKDADGCCPAGCTEANDNDCGCGVNLALSATPLSSGGGDDGEGYGPKKLNDGVYEQGCMNAGCSACFCWINNTTTPGGAFIEYDWKSIQTIGSIFVDAKDCATNCSAQGRSLFSGKIDWWDGAKWVTAHTFTGIDGDLKVTLPQKLQTTKLRLYDLTTGKCGQGSNTLIFEWGVYGGSNCGP